MVWFPWGCYVDVEHDTAMMCYIVTALVTLPGVLLSIQASATVMLHRGIGVRTLPCPSICLTYLRDVLKPPVEPERRKENEVCYHREKNGPLCEWQLSESHKDIAFLCWHSLSGRRLIAKDMANPVVLSQGAATHTHWWASKLLSSYFNLTLAANNP